MHVSDIWLFGPPVLICAGAWAYVLWFTRPSARARRRLAGPYQPKAAE